jgi:DNA repair exonuclease SbcCD nuclease subunit
MLFLLTSDWHCTDKTPGSRIDDYTKAQEEKINFIQETAKKYKVHSILEAGDLTDTSLLSYFAYRKILKRIIFPIYTIYGQHDLYYRTKGNTPLDALQDAIDDFQILPNGCLDIGNNIHLYGCSYEEKIPVIVNSDAFNILLIHKMLLAKREENWQDDYELGNKFLANHAFDLIVSGDNHQTFVFKEHKIGKKKKYLFNCGSLMRSKIDQIDHKPCIFIFDMDNRSFEQIFIPIQPWQKCFDLERKIKEEE